MSLLDDPSPAATQTPYTQATSPSLSPSPSPLLLFAHGEYDQVSSIANPIATPSSSRSCSRNTTVASYSSRPSSSSGSYASNYLSLQSAATRTNRVKTLTPRIVAASTATNPPPCPSSPSQCDVRHSRGIRSLLTPQAKTPTCSASSTPRSVVNPISRIPPSARYNCNRRPSDRLVPDKYSLSVNHSKVTTKSEFLHSRKACVDNTESVCNSGRDSSSITSNRGRHGFCSNLRLTGCHCCTSRRPSLPVSPAGKDLRLATINAYHQVQPYARSRKSDPEGYLFTCYLDYNRCIKPSPPVCFDSCTIRPEILQYSTPCINPVCDTPRSSSSNSSSAVSSIIGSRRLYSRPPTPVPFTRTKEVHRVTMAGVPVDVKELTTCYLFVVEIPGLKNTDIKVQVENDSILKISGERRREECEECEVKYIRAERQAGKFTRKFNLPTNADLDHISAACQDGLLSVVVPKCPPPELRRPKNFDVKVVT